MNISLKSNSFNTYESVRSKCESDKNNIVDDRACSEYHTTDQYVKRLNTKSTKVSKSFFNTILLGNKIKNKESKNK